HSFSCSHHRAHPDLHSFPTRRSSDLDAVVKNNVFRHQNWMAIWRTGVGTSHHGTDFDGTNLTIENNTIYNPRVTAFMFHGSSSRSEEHTSELQSRENLVCRLLLEKKN